MAELSHSAAGDLAGEIPEDLEGLIAFCVEHPELEPRASLYEYRHGAGWTHLAAFETVADATPERIKEEWGGGKYQVRVRRRTGAAIKAISVPLSGARLAREGEAPAAVISSGSVADTSRLERLEAAVSKLVEVVSSSRHGGTDQIVGLAQAMAQAQAPLLAALASAKAPAATDLGAFGAMLLKAIELGRDTASGSSNGGGYGDVIEGLGRPLFQLIARGMNADAQPALELNPPANGAGPEASSPGELPPGAPGWLTQLRPVLPQLLQLAQMHGDVHYWAGHIVDEADAPTLEWVRAELARREQFEGEFYSWVPAAVPLREWFGRFWTAIGEELEELAKLDSEELEG